MFEKFSDKAINVILNAIEESLQMGFSAAGSEHILLALTVIETTTTVRDLLDASGLKPEIVRAELMGGSGSGKAGTNVDVQFAPSAQEVFRDASRISTNEGSRQICVEHLWSSILQQGNDNMSQVFRNLGVSTHDLRRKLEEAFKEDTIRKKEAVELLQIQKLELSKMFGVPNDLTRVEEKGSYERAGMVIAFAQREAHRLNHSHIGTEQLLLGLIEAGGRLRSVFEDFGLDLESVRLEVEEIIGRGKDSVGQDLNFTPRVKRVLELAWDERRKLGHKYMRQEHLLLGLLREGEGVASSIFKLKGVDTIKLRTAVIALLNDRE